MQELRPCHQLVALSLGIGLSACAALSVLLGRRLLWHHARVFFSSFARTLTWPGVNVDSAMDAVAQLVWAPPIIRAYQSDFFSRTKYFFIPVQYGRSCTHSRGTFFGIKSFVALSLALFVTSASASPSPIVTVALSRTQRSGAYLMGASKADRLRAQLLKSRTPSGLNTVPATNLAYAQYTTRVGIGSPPTYYNLVVDTGSSNTFCGTGTPYVRTNTSVSTGEKVNVTYGAGFFTGLEYLDQVVLAPNLVLKNQSIGDALQYADFPGVDGIVGVGPVDLTLHRLSPDSNATIPTVMNNLVAQKLITSQVLGVYFSPPDNFTDTNGALTYGGIDRGLYEGELTYAPVTRTHPANRYWGINITSTSFGTYEVIPNSTAGIVDTGTTQILLADDFFAVYLKAIPGAEFNATLGLVDLPPSSIQYMKPLTFEIAGRTFVMDVAAQLFPEYQNIALGGVAGRQYGVVGSIGELSGRGLDFILGQKFMERYYTVFDADANRVGFAQTNYTFSSHEG